MSINTNHVTDQIVATTGALTIVNSGTLTVPTTTDTLTINAGTSTLTNKRVTPRIVSSGTIAASGTATPTGDTSDQYEIVVSGTITVAAPSGTPTDGQKLMLRIKNSGTVAGTETWVTTSGGYRAVGAALPTSVPVVTTGVQYVGCIYNTADTFWDVVAVGTL